MKTTQGDEAKKAAILDLIKNQPEKLWESKYEFDKETLKYFVSQDPEYFLNVVEVLKSNGRIDQCFDE